MRRGEGRNREKEHKGREGKREMWSLVQSNGHNYTGRKTDKHISAQPDKHIYIYTTRQTGREIETNRLTDREQIGER